MAFKDVINDYSNGATGTIETLNGGSVGYTVSGNAKTITHAHHGHQSAQIFGNGSNKVTVTFDEPVVGASVTIFGSNSNEKYIVEVDGEPVDLGTLVANGDASFANIGAVDKHKINDDGSLSGGYHTDGSVGQVIFHIPVTSVGATGGNTRGWDGIEIGIDDTSFVTVCFDGETGLRSETGIKRAEDVAIGDRLWTMEDGFQPVTWAASRRISSAQLAAYPHLRPIVIAPGALGQGRPYRTLRVSRQHRLLVSSKIAERLTDDAQSLIPAFRLLGLPGITQDNSLTPVTYTHVMFDAHHILDADGAPAESLLPGPMALQSMTPAAREEILALLPEIADLEAGLDPARTIPSGAQQRAIVKRHLQNAQPLLQTFSAP